MTLLATARYFPRQNLRYTIILKNACSSTQATLLESEGIATRTLSVKETHLATWNFPDRESDTATKFVIVRDPLKRFVSAFLDRVVMADFWDAGNRIVSAAVLPLVRPDLTHDVSSLALSFPYDEDKKRLLGRLSVVDIVRIIALTPDEHAENHFKSQRWFMGGRDHDVVISMENPSWREDLSEVLGRPLVTKRPHATQHFTRSPGETPGADRLTVAALREQFAATRTLPAPDDLLTDEVRILLRQRYRDDFSLVAYR